MLGIDLKGCCEQQENQRNGYSHLFRFFKQTLKLWITV
jgi:hypothetical protein